VFYSNLWKNKNKLKYIFDFSYLIKGMVLWWTL